MPINLQEWLTLPTKDDYTNFSSINGAEGSGIADWLPFLGAVVLLVAFAQTLRMMYEPRA